MAVVNYYIDSNLANGYKQDPDVAGGSKALITYQSFNVAASDSSGSIYRIGKINSNAMLFDCKIACEALTGTTSVDLGVYGTDLGAVVNKNIFMSAQTFASASRSIDGLSAVPVGSLNKRIWELLGLASDPQTQYDLAFTVNTAGGTAGNVTIKLLTSQY